MHTRDTVERRPCFSDVLLEWLTTGDNYARWAGEPQTSSRLCDEINRKLSASGLRRYKTTDIRQQIHELEVTVAKARQLLTERGFDGCTTLKQCDNERLKTQILRYCPHFELLAPVMTAPSRPAEENAATKTHNGDSGTKTDEGQASPVITDRKEVQQSVINAPEDGKTDAPALGRAARSLANEEAQMASSPGEAPSHRNQIPLGPAVLMNRLVEWFRCDDSYVRWKTAKFDAAAEINSALREQGVCHVEDSFIAEMMSDMEQAFLNANELLAQNGISDPSDLRRCSKKVRHRIQQRCSCFTLLAPVMSPQHTTKESGYDLPDAKRQRSKSTLSSETTPRPLEPDSADVYLRSNCAEERTVEVLDCDSMEWESDVSNGKSAIEVLMEWLLTESNYARFQTSDLMMRKNTLVSINNTMQAEGIHHLTSTSISQKIAQLQRSMVQAEAIIQQRGVRRPVVFTDIDEGLKRKVLECCPYYELLALVMETLPTPENRDNVEPILSHTSDDGGNDSKDDQESLPETPANTASAAAKSVAAETESSEPSVSTSRAPLEVMDVIDPSIPANKVWNIVFVNGKSANDVLLEWLTAKGNYFEFRRSSNFEKNKLYDRILSHFHDNGIRYRCKAAIQRKIVQLHKTLENAQEILSKHGFRGAVSLQSCRDHVQSMIMKFCPHFDLLAPVVFANELSESAPAEAQPTVARQVSTPIESREAVSSEQVEVRAASTRECIDLAQDEARESPEVSGTAVEADPDGEFEILESKPPAGYQESSPEPSIKLEYIKGESAQDVRAIMTGEVSDHLDLDERRVLIEMEQERAQIELAATREKIKIQIAVELALARQKLLDGGLSEAEVDHLMPMNA